MKDLILNRDSLRISQLIKDKALKEIIDILKDKNIEVELDILNTEFCRGRYTQVSDKNHEIYINVDLGIKEDFEKFNRRGVLGDIYNPNCRIFIPKNEYECGIYSVMFTMLHEYKHYVQRINGKLMDDLDITLNNTRYVNPVAQELEMEAEDFALENVVSVYEGLYESFK